MAANRSEGRASGLAEEIGETLFYRIPATVIATLGLAQVAINFANVLLRYQFHAPIIWAEEFLALTLVWVVFLGVVMVTWRWDHLSVDLFSQRLSPRMRTAFDVVIGVAILVACFIIAMSAQRVVGTTMKLGTRSIIMKYPMAYAHIAVLVGACLQMAAVVWRFGLALAGKPLVRHIPRDDLPAAAEHRLDHPKL